ncbi:MAG TPA: prolipoprotein diacylglyceryl transferase [Sutterella sp.]|nr:prolipoprotein diacylglyceryl transferase [Sutterella sp.]
MFIHPQFDPVAFSIGPLSVRWYGLAYLAGFAFFWLFGRYRAREAWRGISIEGLEDLLFFGMLGVIVGGRLGFCFFYQPQWFAEHPADILKVWQGGMSAHGGIIGVIVAMAFYSVKTHTAFLRVADFVVPLVPLGLFFGRIGNFINGELWGRVADPALPWAMIFPQSGTFAARHPSQLYEAIAEGLFLFVLLWVYSTKPRKPGSVAALFCVGYAVARFVVEFFREPDAYLGLGMLGFSRGQWLTLPVLVVGLVLFWISRNKKNT